jgi:hypothetical protein
MKKVSETVYRSNCNAFSDYRFFSKGKGVDGEIICGICKSTKLSCEIPKK